MIKLPSQKAELATVGFPNTAQGDPNTPAFTTAVPPTAKACLDPEVVKSDAGRVAHTEPGSVDVLADAPSEAEVPSTACAGNPQESAEPQIAASASTPVPSEPSSERTADASLEPASFIKFFVNGHDCGIAFQDMEQSGAMLGLVGQVAHTQLSCALRYQAPILRRYPCTWAAL